MRPLICLLALLLAGSALATDIPDLSLSYAVIPSFGGSIWVSPGGNGPDMAHGFSTGGGALDLRITLTLIGSDGSPIYLYPREDIWLESEGGGLSSCIMGTAPDSNTDLNGETVFTGPFRAGGNNPAPEGLQVVVSGMPLPQASLPIQINSPDVNGDLVVNLSDIGAMTQALFGEYDWRFDFNNDGAINLIDIVAFASSYGMHCGS